MVVYCQWYCTCSQEHWQHIILYASHFHNNTEISPLPHQVQQSAHAYASSISRSVGCTDVASRNLAVKTDVSCCVRVAFSVLQCCPPVRRLSAMVNPMAPVVSALVLHLLVTMMTMHLLPMQFVFWVIQQSLSNSNLQLQQTAKMQAALAFVQDHGDN